MPGPWGLAGSLDSYPGSIRPVYLSLGFISAPREAGAATELVIRKRRCSGIRQVSVIVNRSGPVNPSAALGWTGDFAPATDLFSAVRHIG